MVAQPQPAATVILLRDAAPSPEVLMIERHSRSGFLPDMYVFPGGRVDEEDHALADRISGVDPAALLPQFEPDRAPAFFVAAIRETFEEAGILLARRRGESRFLDAAAAEDLSRHRLDVQSGELSFRALVEREKLDLAADCLSVHAHWITPEAVPRRFDTVFFAAIAPPGQLAAHDGFEATDHLWIRPEDALDQMQAAERRIIFPTASNLRTICGFDDAGAALQSSRERPVVPVLPKLVERDGKRLLAIPEEAGYPIIEEPLPEAHP
jgi:8-oxo-dGTP pyrophosphatase MutT (NUDIX family)